MGILDNFRDKRSEEKPEEMRETPSDGKPALGRWQVGDRIADQYEIHHILGGPGRSGMGIVYVCYDHGHRRAIAIKTLQDQFLQDRAAINRFKWEAEAWVRLEKHCNIVRAEFVHVMEGRPYIFMEYVMGDERYGANLCGWIWRHGLQRAGKADIPLILNFAIQLCYGMIHAEKKFGEMGKPFIHRDVKPQNIMITSNKVVKVTDFGLVKAFAEADNDIPSVTVGDEFRKRLSFSKSGALCGTPPYMSPEQCRGERDIDVRSDVYAFGCVLYEMVTQRYVFDGRTPEEFVNHHLKSRPKSPDAHKELDKVVLQCLEKDPDRRYHDFNELEKILSALYDRLTGKVVKQPKGAELEAWELAIKGLSLSNLGIHEEAVACLMQAVKLDPNDPDTHGALGFVYAQRGNHDAAVIEYQKSLRGDPNNATTHLHLGMTFGHQKNFDAAAAEYTEALRIDPGYAKAHHGLGQIHYDQFRLHDAEREYKESLRIDPNDAGVHCNLGGVYQLQARLAEAQEEYIKALKINPNFAFARYKWGSAYLDAYRSVGKPVYLDAAVKQFREAIRIHPHIAGWHYDLGEAYRTQGKLDEAVAEHKEALRLNPNSAGSHFKLGAIYSAQRKLDETVREYGEALKINPNYAEAHTNLGNAYKDKGQLDEAIREYKEALRINPNSVETHFNLGTAYTAQRKFDDAVREYVDSVRIDPNFFQAHSNLGIVYQAQGRLDEAVRECMEVLRINPNFFQAYFNLGIAHEAKGEFREAIECYQRFISLASPQDATYVRRAEEIIRELKAKI